MSYFKGHSTSCAREHKPCIGLPPLYIMPYVEIENLNVTIYVSLVACMSVGRVLTHTDMCMFN